MEVKWQFLLVSFLGLFLIGELCKTYKDGTRKNTVPFISITVSPIFFTGTKDLLKTVAFVKESGTLQQGNNRGFIRKAYSSIG